MRETYWSLVSLIKAWNYAQIYFVIFNPIEKPVKWFWYVLDFVLVYAEEEGKQPDPKHIQFREKFLSNLKKSNIDMEEVKF